ncbi:putative RNA methylase [Ignisphaera aggregans DSM 17230]|uniref:Putative RNA methylase n=1 Tax=Ignisphaera aggregans (strain DSM 17230 / JCM 13409 / AQ1.S1) TaxID=583356 RepID=E0SPM7_IGNAA|nr:putative RNA methylase [Ignisphaera aggregans DSM 17230]
MDDVNPDRSRVMRWRWLSDKVTLLLTCDTGLETLLLDEISSLVDIDNYYMFPGRVFITISNDRIANVFRSRIVNNIYLLLFISNNIDSLDKIYNVIRSIDFSHTIYPHESFAIRSERIGQHTFTSIDIARVAGQAVIDSYMASRGVRLKVNLDNPDIEIYTELNNDRLLVGLALTRRSLHIRNRLFYHPASLKSSIAAAMLRYAEWRPEIGIVDPMCGSGTIPIEAALIAKGVEVPCININAINIKVLERIHAEVVEHIKRLCRDRPNIDVDRRYIGIDINPKFVEGAIINAKNMGVDDITLFISRNALEVIPIIKSIEHEFGVQIDLAIFNPPYGHRMKPGKLFDLYLKLLQILKDSNFRRAVFITSAIRVTQRVIDSISDIVVNKIKIIHGTLPSYIYRIDFIN